MLNIFGFHKDFFLLLIIHYFILFKIFFCTQILQQKLIITLDICYKSKNIIY